MSSYHHRKDLCLIEAVRSQLQEYADYKLVIALSGSADSMVLCHIVTQITTCELVFANSKRGEGDQRAIALRDWAAVQGYTLYIYTSEIPLVAHRDLRTYKYAAIEKHVDNKTLVLVGHHLNDQIETLFLKSMRGYNPEGWIIPKTRALGSGLILRPLLDFSKAEIIGYAQKNNVFYIEDPTNAYLTQPRNYLRHLVLQKLLAWCPAALLGWQKSLNLFREERLLLNNFKQRLFSKCLTVEGYLWLTPWMELPTLEQRWVLRWWLKTRHITRAILEHWQAILSCSQDVWHYKLSSNEVLWKYHGYAGVSQLLSWDAKHLEKWIQEHISLPRKDLTIRVPWKQDKLTAFFKEHKIHPIFRAVARVILHGPTLIAIYPYGLYNPRER